jgi:hypothetical protein
MISLEVLISIYLYQVSWPINLQLLLLLICSFVHYLSSRHCNLVILCTRCNHVIAFVSSFLRFFVSAYVFFEPAMFCKTWKPAVNAPVARQVDMQRTMEGFLNPNTKEALNPAKKGLTQSVRFRSRSEAHNVPLNTPINTLKAAVLPAT